MGRMPRFIPENDEGILVEVSCRTINAWALLRPSRRLADITVGVLGRALEVSPIEIAGLAFLATHYHLLCVVRDQQQLTRFMQNFQTNLSKEVGRLIGWKGTMWGRRYDAVVVSDEPEVQWARLKYVLAHGVKEGLVESPLDWPGVHAAGALVHGEPLVGHWFNRSHEWAARRRGEAFGTYDYATRYAVGLSPLPAFRDLSAEEYRQKIAELIWEIEAEGVEQRAGRPVLGVKAILAKNPFEVPSRKMKKSPRPQFHAKGKEAWKALWEEFREFLMRYREAASALRSGDSGAEAGFPAGCYPPTLPFVGEVAPPCPPWPPTRRLVKTQAGIVERGEVPVVSIPGRRLAGEPRARGQPG